MGRLSSYRSTTTSCNANTRIEEELRASVQASARLSTTVSSHRPFVAIAAQTLAEASTTASGGSSSQESVGSFQRRPLKCTGSIIILGLLLQEEPLRASLPLAILRDFNEHKTTAAQVLAVITEILQQIDMIMDCPQLLADDVVEGKLIDERNRQLLKKIYADLCGVCAAVVAARTLDSDGDVSNREHIRLLQSNERVADICYWVDRMVHALREGGSPLQPAQYALGSVLPLLQDVDAETAKRFRRALSNAYATTTPAAGKPLNDTFLSVAAKIHFMCAVGVPFVMTHYVIGFAKNLYSSRLDGRTIGTVLAFAIVVYMLVFQKKSTAPSSSEGSPKTSCEELLPLAAGAGLKAVVSSPKGVTVTPSSILSALSEKES